jgi:hypothetical protein
MIIHACRVALDQPHASTNCGPSDVALKVSPMIAVYLVLCTLLIGDVVIRTQFGVLCYWGVLTRVCNLCCPMNTGTNFIKKKVVT